MPQRGVDDAFEAHKGDPSEDTLRRLVEALTSHGYAVTWQELRARRLDVVNGALVRIVRAIPKFRGEAKFSTFAHRIFLNECKRVAGKEGRVYAREVSLDNVEGLAAEEIAVPSMHWLLGQLSPEDGRFFSYKELGETDEQLAARFHLSRSGVRVRWHRIRRRLQGLLRSTSGAHGAGSMRRDGGS